MRGRQRGSCAGSPFLLVSALPQRGACDEGQDESADLEALLVALSQRRVASTPSSTQRRGETEREEEKLPQLKSPSGSTQPRHDARGSTHAVLEEVIALLNDVRRQGGRAIWPCGGAGDTAETEQGEQALFRRDLASLFRHSLRRCSRRAFLSDRGAPASPSSASLHWTDGDVLLRRQLLAVAVGAFRAWHTQSSKERQEGKRLREDDDEQGKNLRHAPGPMQTQEDWDLLFATATAVLEAVYIHLIDSGAAPQTSVELVEASSPRPAGVLGTTCSAPSDFEERHGSALIHAASSFGSGGFSETTVFSFLGERTFPPSAFFGALSVVSRVLLAGQGSPTPPLFAPNLRRRRASVTVLLKLLSQLLQECWRLCLPSSPSSFSSSSSSASASPAVLAEKSAGAGGEAVRLLQLLQPLLVTGAVYVHPVGAGPARPGVRTPGSDDSVSSASFSSPSSRSRCDSSAWSSAEERLCRA
ncbi:hypothetical protein TGARI_230950A, partial [Toxoplasma gondii ARI]